MYLIFKRLIDILAASVALLILTPIFVPVMIALRFTAEGEVFYSQSRVGYKNRYFKIWKFATMLKNSPNMGTGSLTLRNDPRVTTIGRYLRITKINELPQLINLLTGDMTLVGPRPQMKVDFEAFPAAVQERIYDVRPGITGIGSIIFRDEEKMLSETTLGPREFYVQHIAPYKGAVELWYQENISFGTDLKLLWFTFKAVLSSDDNSWKQAFKGLPQAPEEIRRFIG